MTILVVNNKDKVIEELGKLIEETAENSIKTNGIFLIGFSGGSLVNFLTTALPKIKTDFSKWRIFFCDERVVPTSDPESTFGVYKKAFIDSGAVDLKENQFIQIKQDVSGHKLLTVTDKWIAPITDSPKPPPSRVTMTFPVLNNARVCVFATSGKEKAHMIKKVLVDKEDLPATKVNPHSGNLYWIVDREAADSHL
ncbi:6-phosphogluconolactonase isoform X2 [Diorhabda sublineata]|uniref:6-phosphogluconolactonase isoform X2 n=1 Tax=Diorhabda sublineata TaxID=1163346 RepID=UPI0024E04876|nr:6-phosphogluconolactonase isoform X2 [Diorhabda sublineata]